MPSPPSPAAAPQQGCGDAGSSQGALRLDSSACDSAMFPQDDEPEGPPPSELAGFDIASPDREDPEPCAGLSLEDDPMWFRSREDGKVHLGRPARAVELLGRRYLMVRMEPAAGAASDPTLSNVQRHASSSSSSCIRLFGVGYRNPCNDDIVLVHTDGLPRSASSMRSTTGLWEGVAVEGEGADADGSSGCEEPGLFVPDAGRFRRGELLGSGGFGDVYAYKRIAGAGRHTVLLWSDGTAVACGENVINQCFLPVLPAGLTYTQVAAGGEHTVLLRSDGTAVACGENVIGWGLPVLPAGLTYTQVAAGGEHTVLLRSDGTAVACGENVIGWGLPVLPAGLTYTQVAAGGEHTVLLRSDGTAVACGETVINQCFLPVLPAGLTYTQVAAGGGHTVLLRSDGTAVACGWNAQGQRALPSLPAGLTYTQVAAGGRHTVLLRSDGSAVACGWNAEGQCALPALPAGLTYTQVAAGERHTVLLKSDGSAVACGWNDEGQCELPVLPVGLTYMAHLLPAMLLQASLDGDTMRFMTFGGAERSRSWAGPGARLADIYEQLLADHRAGRLGPGAWRVDAVLPGGRLLSSAAAEEIVAEAFELPRAT
ncbi:unnamed protein product [Prorocentrum cordatum]|uniref:Uncharacterized protein n=1 Tax=Prorocentrum cordatum TaxID=2364126 RepID=A0ABN9XHG8_9DINO|nr:unnamed protein product [Polarella glacialis]